MAIFEEIKDLAKDEFQRTVGISLPNFLLVVQLVTSFIEKEKQENPMKKRGLKSKLTLYNQVLLFFYYLRDYPTFLKLGQRFSIWNSSIIILRCLPRLDFLSRPQTGAANPKSTLKNQIKN